MRFSARGVAAMTEANGRLPGPCLAPKGASHTRLGALALLSAMRGEAFGDGSTSSLARAGDLVRGKARGAPRVLRIGP
jgi:hypothetical protein